MTVVLAVDVGNSQTKLGWFEDAELRRADRFPTGTGHPAEMLVDILGQGAQPSGAVMCSGVPDAIAAWRYALRETCGTDPLVVTGDSDIGIANQYDDPTALGPDRLVGALAARELYGAPVVVVSLGTATVVDAVSREGEYLGGAIAPGAETSLAALSERTALLPRVPFEATERAIAANTRGAMIAGAYFGAVGQVRELLARVRDEMGEDAPAVLTGGLTSLVADKFDHIAAVEPWLTLHGLRLAWQYVHRQRA